MERLKIITTSSETSITEGAIAINTNIPGYPFLEVCHVGGQSYNWEPVTGRNERERLTKLDDLYSYLRAMDWGIGPRIFESPKGELWMDPEKKDNPIPVLGSTGFKISENTLTEDIDKLDNICMNKEIDFYYDYLVSTRDLLEKSSVIDLFTYPIEYGNILNLSELPEKKDSLRYTGSEFIIKLGVGYIKNGSRYTEETMFTPWIIDSSGALVWTEFSQSLGGNVLVEFHDGCIRLFPEIPEVTECIILHCSAFYEQLL